MSPQPVRRAFLPSAGLGTRLRPLTDTTPKPLLPVAGRPLIEHVLDRCLEAGIREFLINTHHLPGAFETHFPDRTYRGRPVRLVHEPERLETGGGFKNIEALAGGEPLLVHNSDILTDLDLRALLSAFVTSGTESLLAARETGPQRHLRAGRGGKVTAIEPGNHAGEPGWHQYLGVFVATPGLFAAFAPGSRESLVDGWRRRIATHPGSVAIHTGGPVRWSDIGTPDTYARVRDHGLAALPVEG